MKRRIAAAALAMAMLLAFTAASAEEEYKEPEKIYGEGDENYQSDVPEELWHIYLEEEQTNYANAINACSLSDDEDVRTVNVLISQQSHTASTITVYGNYAVYDKSGSALFIAANGAEYTLKSENEKVCLYSAAGTLLYSGASLSFKEFEGENANNCIKIGSVSMGSSVSDRTYRGNVSAYYFDKSGSYSSYWAGLYIVNEVYMEDYAEGVLAAEMGAGYEANAQQAQAIVIRSFAIQSRSSSRVFDVRDTSASQAYFGITDVCRAAVEATAGKSLYYNGEHLRVHYSATNGGETEITNNQWSGNEFCGEETVKEDTSDLKSTTKYVETVQIPASPTGSETAVQSLITNALIPALNSAGYSVTTATVTGISMSTRCDDLSCDHHHRSSAAGQVCNHFCSVDITFSGISTDVGYIDEYTVNLTEKDFYVSPSNGRPLGFFTKGACSRYWLEYENGVYTIRHARYGPGVGLSQYGANYRAANGESLSEILDFYYPNSTVGDICGDTSRPAIGTKPSTKYDARVLGSEARVFAQKTTASEQLGTIAAGDTVFVSETSGKWAKVTCGDISGYIAASALERTAVKVTTANISKSIEVRESPDSRTSSIYTAKKGVVLELIEANAAPGWHKVSTANGAGYISARYSALIFSGTGEDLDESTGLETVLSYYGAAVKLSGEYGLRVRFGISEETHDSASAYGYTIKEYGIIVDGEKRSAYYTENGTLYDKVSGIDSGTVLFAAKVENISADGLKTEHSFKPYIVAENENGTVTCTGDEVKISVYDTAKKLEAEYDASSEEGAYIAALIAAADAE